MLKRKWFLGVALLALIGIAVLVRGLWTNDRAAARVQTHARVVPVEVAKAVRKDVPVRIEALGTVTPIASVAIKARIDTAIESVHFQDGAHVTTGEVLFTLDCRAVDAQIAQTEGRSPATRRNWPAPSAMWPATRRLSPKTRRRSRRSTRRRRRLTCSTQRSSPTRVCSKISRCNGPIARLPLRSPAALARLR